VNIESITWSNSLANIGEYAFYHCENVKTITLPNSLTKIGIGGFFGCRSLKSITLPSSLISIGSAGFANCYNLTYFTNLNPNPIEIIPSVFDNVNQGACTLKVPMNSVSAYQNAPVWKNFKIEGIEVGVVETDNYPSLQVYPNPTAGELTIDNGQLTITGIEVFDIYGRKLTSHSSFLTSNSFTSHSSPLTSIDISEFPAGVYFVRVRTEEGEVVKKVVKR
jgi:hypothetical protein